MRAKGVISKLLLVSIIATIYISTPILAESTDEYEESVRNMIVTDNHMFNYSSYSYNYDFEYDFGKTSYKIDNDGLNIYAEFTEKQDKMGLYPKQLFTNYGAVKNVSTEAFDNIGEDIFEDDPDYLHYKYALFLNMNYDFMRTAAETPSTIYWDNNNTAILEYNGTKVKAKLTTDKSGKPIRIDYTLESDTPVILKNLFGMNIAVKNMKASSEITGYNKVVAKG